MKIVECPVCDSKFDIEKVPDGTKLKCGKCQKVFGVVHAGEMVPVSAPPPPVTEAPVAPTPEAPAEEQWAEESAPSQPTVKATARRTAVARKPVRPAAPPKPKPKPEPLMYVGAIVALVAIATFFIVMNTIQNSPLKKRITGEGGVIEKNIPGKKSSGTENKKADAEEKKPGTEEKSPGTEDKK